MLKKTIILPSCGESAIILYKPLPESEKYATINHEVQEDWKCGKLCFILNFFMLLTTGLPIFPLIEYTPLLAILPITPDETYTKL